MKSEKLKSILKGVWQFCSYVFVPQWGKKRREAQEEYEINLMER